MSDERKFHPAFPQPEDSAVRIWRYMDVSKFEWLVECQRLLMPNATQLGDPLEGTAPDGNIEWWRRVASDASSDKKRQIIEHNRSLLSTFARQFRDNFHYVSCWHMNQHENQHMWSRYTNRAESLAIWTSYNTLRVVLPHFVYTGAVRYIDYAADMLPTWNMFEYIMHKDMPYQFEQEVRAVAFPPSTPELGAQEFEADLFRKENDPGFVAFAPHDELTRLIQGIVLHPDATSDFTAQITELCATNDLPAPGNTLMSSPPAS